MRSLLLLLFAAMLACIGCQSAPQPVSPNDHASDAREISSKTVALVESRKDRLGVEHTRAYCSGVWVSPTLILTASHCVIDDSLTPEEAQSQALAMPVQYATARDVVDENDDVVLKHDAVVEAVDMSHDLALIRAPLESQFHAVAYVAFGVTQGQFAQAMGQSLGLWYSYSTGTVAAVRKISMDDMVANASDMTWVQATASISPGNSGGGLFDEAGNLIGICQGTFTRGQNLNLFVHRDHIAALLRAHGVVL